MNRRLRVPVLLAKRLLTIGRELVGELAAIRRERRRAATERGAWPDNTRYRHGVPWDESR